MAKAEDKNGERGLRVETDVDVIEVETADLASKLVLPQIPHSEDLHQEALPDGKSGRRDRERRLDG